MMPSKYTNERELAVILSNNDFFTITPKNEKELFESFPKPLQYRVKKIVPWTSFTEEDGKKYNLISPESGLSPVFYTRLKRMSKNHNPFV